MNKREYAGLDTAATLCMVSAFLMVMVLSGFRLVNASMGYIRINTTTVSVPGQEVEAGGDVCLYVGGVAWSGAQLYMLMGRDGFSQVSSGDLRFTPRFNLANVTASSVSFYNYTDDLDYPGLWNVGYNWINGSIAKEIAGGNYFIKAFDGTATSVAVTDTYITVIASLEVEPTEGPGGASITLKGCAFLPNDKVNLTYSDGTAWLTIASLVSTDSLGRFSYSISAPDLMQALPAGENAEAYDTIVFRAVENSTAKEYTADFNEWQRGLMQVDGKEATVGLYGDLTDLSLTVMVEVFEEIIVAGKWFHPGSVNLLWDGVTNIGTATANQTGFFNTTITIPETSVGAHNITVKDATTEFFVTIYVTPTLVLVPKEGPLGTVVTAKGYGFPASTASTVHNATIIWHGYGDSDVTWALTDSSGKFTTTFTVPHDYGGQHGVVAVTNDTDSTTAIWVFTITPTPTPTPTPSPTPSPSPTPTPVPTPSPTPTPTPTPSPTPTPTPTFAPQPTPTPTLTPTPTPSPSQSPSPSASPTPSPEKPITPTGFLPSEAFYAVAVIGGAAIIVIAILAIKKQKK